MPPVITARASGRHRLERELEQLGLGRDEEVLRPDGGTRLDRFVRTEKSWPQWRVLAYLDCGGIEIERAGVRVKAKAADERLRDGDLVHLADPLPPACDKTVKQPDAARYRDVAFAPGTSAYDVGLQTFFDYRTQTQRLRDPADLTSFVLALQKGTTIDHPVRHVVIGSHAHESGLMQVPISPMSRDVIQIEDLTASPPPKIAIPDSVFLPRPKDVNGIDIPPAVHIKGCNVGRSQAFLAALKKAMGNKVVVTAPKFFHHLMIRRTRTRPPKVAVIWEYMAYDFTVESLKPLTWAQAISAFADPARGFRLIDGSAIPQRTWESWVQKTTWGRWTPDPGGNANGYKYVRMNVNVVLPTTGKADVIANSRTVRYLEAARLRIQDVFAGRTDPKDNAARLGLLETSLAGNTGVEAQLKRLGFKTVKELVAGLAWRFDVKGGAVTALGFVHEYTVMRPIVDPSTDTLYMNSYPATPRADAFQLLESDRRFFGAA